MKVLHIIWHLGQGGAQTYLYNLLKVQCADQQLSPELLVLSSSAELSAKFEELLPVTYIRMKSGFDIYGVWRLYVFLKKLESDVIHSHTNNIAVNTIFFSIRQLIVSTEHGGDLLGGRISDRIFYRCLYRPIQTFVAISQDMKAIMIKSNPKIRDRVRVVYNGLDVEKVERTPVYSGADIDPRIYAASYRVGIVARLEPQKGIDVFLEACAKHSVLNQHTIYIIVGDGSLRAELESHSLRLGIADKTFFLGYREDALELLKLFNVFLFTSIYEPFGLVITEAMSAGIPVVAMHARGAVPEIIEHGHSGLVANGDDVDELARLVQVLLENESFRKMISTNALNRVKKLFTIAGNAQQIKRLYYNNL